MLGGRRLKTGNISTRIDLVILLFLSYQLLLLTDYVIDPRHYQDISNLFLYGTMVLISKTLLEISFNIVIKLRPIIKKALKRRRLRKENARKK
jgi:hypothetical protein